MIGVDTNVLVRFLVQDDPAQARVAEVFLKKTCNKEKPAFVNRIVLCELVWVLDRAYGCSRDEIAQAIDDLARVAELRLESLAQVWRALAVYRAGKADFADALLSVTNSSLGCQETVTFDRNASALSGMRLLK